MKAILFLAFASTLVSTSYAAKISDKSKPTNFIEKLRGISQITSVRELSYPKPGIQRFDVKFKQPIDHFNPQKGHFQQKLVILHRSETEPVVLQTSGYQIFRVSETAIANNFGTNQIQIEHRYFAESTPENPDWSYLNIRQSAEDFHAITQELKKLYPGPWVNTGASKGGMTSTYHRFFYPDDLVGTVADVAPLSFSRSDQRYNQFIRHVGGEAYANCRQKLSDFQVHMLKNRDRFIDQIQGDFSFLGGADVAFEHGVIESVYYFWQYGNPEDPTSGCSAIPDLDNDSALFTFLNMHSDLSDYTNTSLERFVPYFYQAATELGGPDNATSHLEPFRYFEFTIDQYTPKNIPLPYSNRSMRAVRNWIERDADNIIFIYGTFDPWTAAEYPVSQTGKNVHKYYVEGGNHGVKFTNLDLEARSQVITTLSQWLGKSPLPSDKPMGFDPTNPFGSKVHQQTLEDYEFEARKHIRIGM